MRIAAGAIVVTAACCMVASVAPRAGDVSTASWRPVKIERQVGAVSATLVYESRPAQADAASSSVRRVELVMRREGRIVLKSSIRTVSGVEGVRLSLRNVWGSSEPEALVSMWECGNRCGVQLAIGVVAHGRGRVLWHDFGGGWGGNAAWSAETRAGRFSFVSRDQRFFCAFSDCASSTTPIQVFAVDATGARFVDVTRKRPDLIAVDATILFDAYSDEIRLKRYATAKRAGYGPLGVLAPWCADEYLLGDRSLCEQTLSRAREKGYLNASNGGTPRAISSLHAQLRAWGYSK